MANRPTPTDKMLAFAEKIATRKGIPLPAAARENFEACRDFIDANNTPSDKQVEFAEKIAAKAGIKVPAECLKDAGKMSKWIDEHKG